MQRHEKSRDEWIFWNFSQRVIIPFKILIVQKWLSHPIHIIIIIIIIIILKLTIIYVWYKINLNA